jgi:hypothetical protein
MLASTVAVMCAIAWLVISAKDAVPEMPQQPRPETSAPPTAAPPTIAPPTTAPPTPAALPATSNAPRVDRSMRDFNKASHVAEDVTLAYNSLTWVATQFGPARLDENKLYQDTLVKINNCVWDKTALNLPAAIRFLEECMRALPDVGKRPNVKLAHLLLIYCDGDHERPSREINDPSFLVLGDDNLTYRVELLCRLGAYVAAEQLLDDYLTSGKANAMERSQALLERGRLRASLASFAGARSDAAMSLQLMADNPLEKAKRQSDLSEMEKDYPAYSDYLKSLPEK